MEKETKLIKNYRKDNTLQNFILSIAPGAKAVILETAYDLSTIRVTASKINKLYSPKFHVSRAKIGETIVRRDNL